MARILGINLGTTNFFMAIIEGSKSAVIKKREDKRSTPSVVASTKTVEGKVRMNKGSAPIDRIKIGLGIMLLAAFTGCVGFVDGGYGGAVVVPGPEVSFWGGDYDRGRDVHVYSQRGVASRAVAHPARSAPVHASGGGHGERH